MEIEIFTSLMMTHIFQSKQIEKPARRLCGGCSEVLRGFQRERLKNLLGGCSEVLRSFKTKNTILRAEVAQSFKIKKYTPGGGCPEVPRSFKTKILYSGRRSPGVLKQYYTPGGGPRSFKTKILYSGGFPEF